MPIRPPILYRGTTAGWPGNDVLQELGFTPTTQDPLVATLFALDASRYGRAVVQRCEMRTVIGLIGPSNNQWVVEREVKITVPPRVFEERYVAKTLPALRAREILAEMGFELAPVFADRDVFRRWLYDTPRLNNQEIGRFNELAIGGE